MKKERAILLNILLVLALVLPAIANSPVAAKSNNLNKSTKKVVQTAKKGGTLKIGVNAEINHNMMSFSMTGASTDYVYAWPIYESLFRPNAKGTLDPWLLKSYAQDPKALTYTFHIRKNVKFSDGSVFNAKVCKWNLDHYLKVGAKRTALLGSIKSVDIVDDYTVKLQLSTWSSIIPYAFSRECGYMFSELQYETKGDVYCQEHPVGTGPFILKSWTRDVNKVFVKNKNYWGGVVNLDSVEYIVYPDALVAQAALSSGEIDVYAGMTWTGALSLEKEGFRIGTSAVKSHCAMLVFNSLNKNGNDPTGNLLVRQAICHAINTKALVQSVWHGFATPTNQFGVGTHYFNKNIVGYKYDVKKAKELLAKAGYPDGFSTILTTQDSQAQRDTVAIIQAYLKKVGINAQIKVLSGADGNAAETGWGSGMFLHTSSVYVSVPMQMSSMFRQHLTGGVLGLSTMLRPDDVDAALDKAAAASSEAEAVKTVGEANKLLIDKYCTMLPFAQYPYFYVVNKKVKNSDIGDIFYSIASLGKAWIQK
jgi:peptide/nickel transport system substrate-binding protein